MASKHQPVSLESSGKTADRVCSQLEGTGESRDLLGVVWIWGLRELKLAC